MTYDSVKVIVVVLIYLVKTILSRLRLLTYDEA